MRLLKKLQILPPLFLSLFFFFSPAFAAAPDGTGPWADSVVSSSQGLMKNGSPVAATRSDTSAALGVAENDSTVDSHFFSLGFGGNIVLGFDNGISSGVLVIEATNPDYPGEKAKIEVSENATTWVTAGNVVQDGTVAIPDEIACAKFVRITDTSDPAIMPDDIADGYDVDGVQATGDLCNPTQTPTPAPTSTPAPTTPPSSGSNSQPNSNSNSNSSSNSNSGSNTNSGSNPAPTTIPTAAPTFTPANTAFVGGEAPAPCPPNSNPLVPCFPDTGSVIPRLPNSGIGPDDVSAPWRIPAGIFFSLVTFYLARKEFTFSS